MSDPVRISERSALGRGIKILSALTVLALLTVGLIDCSGRAALSREVGRIAARGDVLSPADLVFPDLRAGDDPWPWGARLRTAEIRRRSVFTSRDDLTAMIRAREATTVNPEALARLRELESRLPETGAWSMKSVYERLSAGQKTAGLDELQRLVLEVRADDLARVRPLLESARDLRPFDAQTLARDARASVMRVMFIMPHYHAVQSLVDQSLYSAADGREREALEALGTAVHVTRLLRDLPAIASSRLFTVEVSLIVDALEGMMKHLPPDADLGGVERVLESFELRSSLLLALKAERAFTYERVFAPDFKPPTSGLRSATLIGTTVFTRRFDRAYYLGRMMDAIETMESETWRPMTRAERPPFYAPLSGLVEYRPKGDNERVTRIEARRLLALAALVARREGRDAAIAHCEANTDPFSGSPFQHRLEKDGTLVMWSVGPDLVDDGAFDLTDIVWRVEPSR